MRFAVLGVPSSAGAYGVGLERAPGALRCAGLLTLLAERGIDVVDAGDLTPVTFRPDPDRPRAQSLGSVVTVARAVADRVHELARQGLVPIVLGGDCTITLGVVAGLQRAGLDVRLAYFDGDADLSTPETTRSGILDAMGVAHLLGLPGTAAELAGVGPRTPLLTGRQLALIGYEDDEIDERERGILAQHSVHLFPADELRGDPRAVGSRVLAALAGDGRLVVHLDIDAVDSIDLPLAHFPHFNTGVSLEAAGECLAVLLASPELAAITLTEVDPLHDPDDVYIPRFVRSLVSALSAGRDMSGRL